MLIDAGVEGSWLEAGATSAEMESKGYDGVWSSETSHDPFLQLFDIARSTKAVSIGTNIAVAFARNPMTMATVANDLQWMSKGRMILGLGSQIKPHIEKRFSMDWSNPAPRMREFVLAMKAIWACWNDGIPLSFRGTFYRHTLMTPFFNPGPNPFGSPLVMLAGVGEKMTETAGEVCDGFLAHGFTTERYMREVTLPALDRGFANAEANGGEKAMNRRARFQISYPAFVVTGADEAALELAKIGTKRQIAFYGSTPAYRGVLELHGWGGLSEELNRMSKAGQWQQMGEAIDDSVLDAFAVVAEPNAVAAELLRRFGDIVQRISFYTPYESDPALWSEIGDQLRRPKRVGNLNFSPYD